MATAPAERSEARRGSVRPRRPFYASDSFALTAMDAGHVSVEVALGAAELASFRKVAVQAPEPFGPKGGDNAPVTETEATREAFRGAVKEFLRRIFDAEIEQIVGAYRLMLRESLAKAEDPELRAALNRARLQEKLLAGTSMADQSQACELLGLSTANPSATLRRKEERREILRFTTDGRAVYPLFQFDVEGRRLFPTMARLLAMKPKGWSDLRLLHWLTRSHLDMDGSPSEALGDGDAVLAAFEREIEPPVHG